ASAVLLAGAFGMGLVAGAPSAATAQQWEARVLAWARRLLLVVLGSGTVWLLLRTASFENRPEAAFEPWTVWHAVVDTQPGLVWLARHSLLLPPRRFLPEPAHGPPPRGRGPAPGPAVP